MEYLQTARDKNNDRCIHEPRFIGSRTVGRQRPRGLTTYSTSQMIGMEKEKKRKRDPHAFYHTKQYT